MLSKYGFHITLFESIVCESFFFKKKELGDFVIAFQISRRDGRDMLSEFQGAFLDKSQEFLGKRRKADDHGCPQVVARGAYAPPPPIKNLKKT